ncbi:unnamed protein product [Cuscuta epithymum]|uniref:non-specific serine/threonine protein kinase n=1 Tax=Cuscuta epithymum TaxID=186058 RepID=A0AAV0FT17_9ASTE|nr:unnamed protein product [Cuscuta epithymum]
MAHGGMSCLMERYELGRLLGQGAFAKVYYARSIITGQSVAIKVIDKEKVLKVGLTDQIKREISVMRLVRHPNIILLYEVMATKTKIYFVIELAKGGELFNKLAKGRLKEDVARKYFHQLLNAVDFCHSQGVYHRDLKPENLLLDEDGNMKVSDFGLSALAESKRQDGLLHTTCGTPAYVAPEVINMKGYDGAKSDIWSCGVILYVMLAGYLPFHESNLMKMYRKIGKADFRCPNWFQPELRRLLLRMLDPNPSTRISIARIREHQWVKRGMKSQFDHARYEKQESLRVLSFNAFDLISIYSGFDLSRLFQETCLEKVYYITSSKPPSTIINKLEDIAKSLKLNLTKRDAGVLRFEGAKEGRKGTLSIDAEIFELTPAIHLVELKKSNGDLLEYDQIINDGIKPVLEDIVWAPQQLKLATME